MIRLRSACAPALGLVFFLAGACGASSLPGVEAARSASGQFIVSVKPDNSPFFRRPDVSTNADFLHLEAPWLVVSAERFKATLRRELDLPANSSWSGKIFLRLHSAHAKDEPVLIASQPFLQVWDYRLELPDLIRRDRYARALTAGLLLEIANRKTPVTSRSAEIPAWLVDGLARQIMEADNGNVILSAPTKSVDGIAQTRLDEKRRGIDPLAGARRVLQDFPALTFNQLSWPDNARLNGDDAIYPASAQLFVAGLLDLKNGPAKLRGLLAQLPLCENWQSAFFFAFREDFRTPLDVEKWWALRVLAFAARAPGPQWTPAVSRAKLDQMLSVPVEIRYASNALPSHAEVSLQSVIQNFDPPQRTALLQTKLRDLELVELRLAPPLSSVADGYRNILMDFLGERRKKDLPYSSAKRGAAPNRKVSARVTLKKLDALDVQRRDMEAALDKKAIHLPDQ